jgi:hypothetical protein
MYDTFDHKSISLNANIFKAKTKDMLQSRSSFKDKTLYSTFGATYAKYTNVYSKETEKQFVSRESPGPAVYNAENAFKNTVKNI